MNGRREPIGKRALDILSVLAEARGEIVTKDELLEAVWPGVIVEENALQVHIVALRKALGPEAERLKTIRGVGYQLDVEFEVAKPASTSEPQEEASPPRASEGTTWVAAPLSPASAKATRVLRQSVILVIAAAVLALGAWWLLRTFGPSQERTPVVVRQLQASGTDRTETGLAAGITDELVVRLRQIPELRIATAEADGSVPSDSFARAHIVDGSIRSSGDQLRVTARLLDAEGEVLWSQTFDRDSSELFDVQEEIASSIAAALSVSFEVGGNSAEFGGTDNPEAYAAYMQYQAHILDQDFDSRPYLERAVQLDPQYAKARSALYGDYGLQISLVEAADKGRLLREMDRNSREALAATPDLWIPHAGRGMYQVYRHDFIASDRHFERVESRDRGNDPELRSFLANYQMLMGRVRKATSVRRSNELIDPIQRNDPFRVYDLEMLGQYDEAIGLFRDLQRKKQRGLGGFVAHAFMVMVLSGDEEEALRLLQQEDQMQFAVSLRALRNDPTLSGKTSSELRTWARQHFGTNGEFELAFAGIFAAHDGDTELAVKLMRLAFEGPSGGALWSLWHPAMANARKTDAFENLVTDLGMVKAWRESGDWGDYCRPVSNTEITCI